MEKKSVHSKAYEPVVERLIALRKKAGLTIRQLAKRLGRDHHLVWRIENRERRIDLLEFIAFCEACGADPVKEVTSLAKVLTKGVKGVRRKRR